MADFETGATSDPASPRSSTPDAEHPIDDALVRALLREQHPDLANLPLSLVDSGWDNVMVRLGDDWVVRLPRRRQAVPLLRHEQAWLPVLAPRLPLAIPSPLRHGEPGCGYPWPWSIVPWMAGRTADLAPPAANQARPWAEFLRALHRPGPEDAPNNPLRGVPLAERAASVEERLERLRNVSPAVTPHIVDLWQQALAAPPDDSPRWLHGDLHPRNILVHRGRLSGVIDWGDVTTGDIATDLASFWMLFDNPQTRADGLAHYGADDAEIARAQGWAVHFATVLLETGLTDHPRHAAIGQATLLRLGSMSMVGR